ncbi:MAG: hypothetical protein EOS76_24065 [Mesorhizobium sp.]|uniref:hypothetical protein n=1 Tax=unclassified Mesorhizobium TaxID=325217 RepID=UPI000F74D2D1|nr:MULTISPECIES: hypothetical protein [unclassified Mesorhizobium]RVC76918.1 hypothetical protein EN766_12670 [Mesorhizobium sp. M2A.F.Ca.ET.046.02.1.1]AZO34232.1 hypothetical protein EJ072_06995 [Mesorhizobium sp. M2A.F.Ca.ET.046.03.2.1]AZO71664.1 hypothetical protein EJ067_11370 [Mesorhizobium sp. M1D.F.Ca.ET.043.01.1.1]RWB49758.1 MAG: hypothetical protein EOQ44_01100 [Mesorhizobium sp.]RWE14919.1 MAG: hypothetical protein EOS76_24065 [Mesorhizobium sp.]
MLLEPPAGRSRAFVANVYPKVDPVGFATGFMVSPNVLLTKLARISGSRLGKRNRRQHSSKSRLVIKPGIGSHHAAGCPSRHRNQKKYGFEPESSDLDYDQDDFWLCLDEDFLGVFRRKYG